MPEYQGQTDQVLKIKLPSSILGARWGANEVATGGRIMLEVTTQWVADGSEIEIRVKDLEGGAIETLQGKVFAGIHRRQYLVAKVNKTGGMFFEAELKAHKLKAVGPKVKVGPAVEIKEMKWLDEKGSEIKKTKADAVVTLSAKVKGPQPGTPCQAAVYLRTGEKDHAVTLAFTSETTVQDGEIEAHWKARPPINEGKIRVQQELDKEGTKYFPPAFEFKISVLGTSAVSPKLGLMGNLRLKYEMAPGLAGPLEGKKIALIAPDGKRTEYSIPADGLIEVDETDMGHYQVDESGLNPDSQGNT